MHIKLGLGVSMKVEFEKHMHIAGELLSYCHSKGATEYHLDVKGLSDGTAFTISASPAVISDSDMELLNKKLSVPRQKEMEQNYWELSGESETSSELLLVGMMVDEVEVSYDGIALTIRLKRLL